MKREIAKKCLNDEFTNNDKIVDRIFDDFESRVCENCNNFIKDRFNNDENTCIKGCGNIAIGYDVVYCSSDFGCDEWESK